MSSGSTSAAPKRATRRPPPPRAHKGKNKVGFGSVEVISDAGGAPKDARAGSSSSSSSSTTSSPASSSAPSFAKHRSTGGKLRRSPTPVLTSLTELTHAHLAQLSGVWKESNLPGFETDKQRIAATRDGKADPFDF